MAKQLVNPVERHVEKAIASVAAIVLIGVIARYFVMSPNQLEIGGSSAHRHAVYTGFRGSKYQVTFDFTWQKDPNDADKRINPGTVVH